MIASTSWSSGPIPVVVAAGDEERREQLVELLGSHVRLELAGAFATGSGALGSIAEAHPRLLILEVELPDLTAFELVGALPEQDRPEVILVTPESRHAIPAWEMGALDYLVPPLEDERVHRALIRAIRVLEARRPQASTGGWLKRLLVQKSGRSGFFLSVTRLSHLEAYNSYVRLHYDGDSHFLRTSLTALESRLDPAVFQRVHRSFIVNLNHVREITPRGASDYGFVMGDGTVVPVGRAYRDEVLAEV